MAGSLAPRATKGLKFRMTKVAWQKLLNIDGFWPGIFMNPLIAYFQIYIVYYDISYSVTLSRTK